MEIYIIGGLACVAVAMVVYALLPDKQDRNEIVQRRSAGLSRDEDPKVLVEKAKRATMAESVLGKVSPLLSRPVMPKNEEETTTLRSKLASAGFRRENAVSLFLASKTVGGVICLIIGLLVGYNRDQELLSVVGTGIFAAGIGFMLPNLWLRMSINKRVEAIRNGLPDSLDLMVIAVEAGLGLDAALLRVSDEMHLSYPALSEEFQIATIETQMGVPRGEALQKMATRCAVYEMKALVATISQAEKLGTSIAKALRNQAESLRTKRRQRAEERAQKTAVKLLLPLILFIFPTIFIVLAGPAAIQLMDTFSSTGPLKN